MIRIYEDCNLPLSMILARTSAATTAVEEATDDIISAVREDGDAVLYLFAERFDNAKLDALEVTDAEFEEAEAEVGDFIEVLKRAAENITAFHKEQLKQGFTLKRDGYTVGQRITPLKRVGVYIPGGTAAYPSTVLMNVIPARLAGVPEIYVTTPPRTDGKVNPNILAAARLAGVTKVYKVGGAQAIAALAYGTETVPKVDKIVGPGNIFVATAKKKVFGVVDIDMIAGPSEILVIADKTANPTYVAGDLLSQAEHDKNAAAVLVTDDREFAERVMLSVQILLEDLPRREIAEASIENNGKIIVTETIDRAIEIANLIAPEHLELAVKNPEELFDKVQNAGSVFLGHYTPEAVGDYYAGPNHTLPTSGTARFSSPLSVDDFVKKTQFIRYGKDALRRDAADIIRFAETEGLQAHGLSVFLRTEGDK